MELSPGTPAAVAGDPAGPLLRLGTAPGRWAITAAVLASGTVFIESTVVNVALPAIGRDLALGVSGLQWVVNGYLITLSALLLLGGALGDALGQKRMLEAGAVGFAAGSLLSALAPTFPLLVAARLIQGAGGALLVPASLAFLDTAFAEEDRGGAIGLWAGWSAVSTAAGPILGGAVLDVASGRGLVAGIVPLALGAAFISRWFVAAPRRIGEVRVDAGGAILISVSIGSVAWALMEAPGRGASPAVIAAGGVGLGLAAAFIVYEARQEAPLLPLRIFRSRQFSGANAATLLIYAAIGALFFFLMVQLQAVLGYTSLAAGASLLPINALMLVGSPWAGNWAQRSGPRVPVALGSLLAAAGLALFSRVQAGSAYLTDVLPPTLAFGLGLAILVAPLTTSVLSVAEEGRTGIASAVNNAAARVAGLLAVALIPLVTGIGGLADYSGPAFSAAFGSAMWISAGLCGVAAALAWATIRECPVPIPGPHPSPTHGCPRVRRALSET
jgi:EmrB/QacA subfamily drug resistance transporter